MLLAASRESVYCLYSVPLEPPRSSYLLEALKNTMLAPCSSRTWTLTGILNHGYSCTRHLALSMQYCPKGSGSTGSLHEITMSIVQNLCIFIFESPSRCITIFHVACSLLWFINFQSKFSFEPITNFFLFLKKNNSLLLF